MLAAEQRGCLETGASLAALLSERRLCRHDAPGPIQAQYSDCEQDLYVLQYGGPTVHQATLRQIHLLRRDLLQRWGASAEGTAVFAPESLPQLPALFLAAYPDRVGLRRRNRHKRCEWAGGSAEISQHSVFAPRSGQRDPELCVAYLIRGVGGKRRQATIVEGAAIIDRELLVTIYPESLSQGIECHWNQDKLRVDAARVQRFGTLILSYEVGVPVDLNQAEPLLAAYLSEHLEQELQRFPEAWQLWQRMAWLGHQQATAAIQELMSTSGRQALAQSWSQGSSAVAGLTSPRPWIEASLGWELMQAIDRLAPASVILPGGSQRSLDYQDPTQPPFLRLRIQECFGWRDGPRVLAGSLPVVLELLAPNQRPQQRCNDLAGFWAGSYQQVRKDLRGRYPKHAWPEDPANTPAISTVRKRTT